MLIGKIKSSIKDRRLIDKNDLILTAVSGGPDSVCLLYALNSLKKELRVKLACAHLNHMLRAKESKRDLLFVQGLCKKLKIPFYYAEIDINKLKTSASLEEAARKIRQDFLFRTAAEIKADKIALGHTRDDQAETVIMRLLRGSGLYGLSAILPKRKISNHILIRPLIDITKEEILDYLKKKGSGYRIDKTNLQDAYFRNKVRNRLMPQLKKYNKNIASVLANTAQNVSLDYDYIKSQAQKYLTRLRTLRKNGQINIKLKGLLLLHPALIRMILRLAIEKLCGNLRRLNHKHIQELESLLEDRKSGSIVDLPQGISAQKTQSLLTLYKRNNLKALIKCKNRL